MITRSHNVNKELLQCGEIEFVGKRKRLEKNAVVTAPRPPEGDGSVGVLECVSMVVVETGMDEGMQQIVMALPEFPFVHSDHVDAEMPKTCYGETLKWLMKHMLTCGARGYQFFTDDVGMNIATIQSKLEEGTLDHIHHRRTRKLLIQVPSLLILSWVCHDNSILCIQVYEEQVRKETANRERDASRILALEHQANPIVHRLDTGPPAGASPLIEHLPRKAAPPPLVSCPVMKMGYACVECGAKMRKCHIVDHLAVHIATLMKRVHDLEAEMEELKGGGKAVVNLDV